jgi:hypothetical protein
MFLRSVEENCFLFLKIYVKNVFHQIAIIKPQQHGFFSKERNILLCTSEHANVIGLTG